MQARSRAGENSLGRVETRDGPVARKVYGERHRGPRAWVYDLGARVVAGQTPTNARARRATEQLLLAHWREAGLAVPADLSSRHPELADDHALVLEWVEGRPLSEHLADPGLPDKRRQELLTAFARAWGERHKLALARRDVRLVQEHGGVQHVLVSGPRLVTIDLENSFRPRSDVRPLIAKEIAGYLRSLARYVDAESFQRDLRTLVSAYPDREILEYAVHHYLNPSSAFWRLVWTIDRRFEERRARHAYKYRALEALAGELGVPALRTRFEKLGAWLFQCRGWAHPFLVLLAAVLGGASWAAIAAGQLLVGVHLAIRLWACRHLGGAARVHARKAMKARRLVTTGPFARVRNPLYLANAIGLAGACLALGPAWLAGIGFLWVLLWYRPIVAWEERILRQLYPESYRAYSAVVPRLLPRLRPAGTGEAEVCSWSKALRIERGSLVSTAAILVASLVRPFLPVI